MYKKSAALKLAACVTAIAVTFGVLSADNRILLNTSASPDADTYKQQLADLEKQQAELDEKINAADESIEGEQEKLDAVNEKIKSVSEEIQTVSDYTAQLEDEMVELDSKMQETQYELTKKETEIKAGVNDFSKRLRAMYVAGLDSYTDVLVSSSDFYDVLMRMELLTRVAEHDNDAISELIAQKNDIEETKAQLEEQSSELKEKSAEYGEQQKALAESQAELLNLQTEYSEKIAALNDEKSDYEAQSEQLEGEYSKLSSLAATTTTTTTTTTTATTTVKTTTSSRPTATTTKKSVADNTDNADNSGNSDNADSTGTEPVQTTVPQDAVTAATTTTTATPAADADATKAEIVVAYAKSMVGGSYVWAGTQFGATDCSGLVMLSYAQVGISLPHQASSQATYGVKVNYSDMQPGDLIFFGGSSYSSIYHVAMYIGDGRMVHAQNTYTGIVISDVATFSKYNNITCIKRLL